MKEIMQCRFNNAKMALTQKI